MNSPTKPPGVGSRQPRVPNSPGASPQKPLALSGGASGKLSRNRARPGEVTQVGDYQLGDRIGKGQFGSVFKALNKRTGEMFACKQLKFTRKNQSTIGEIMQEIELLKSLKHTNIVRYVSSIQEKDTVNIIMEYIENGSLLNIVNKFGAIPEELCIQFMEQILQGLKYLHSEGVIHRDIKAANILISKSGKVCLADFGVSSQLEEGTGRMTVVGSPNWMAPEVISMAGTTAAADIWSFGCTVIELLSGYPPYADLGSMGALYRIVEDDKVPYPPDISPDMENFLDCCFQKDQSHRSTASELLAHRIFSKSKDGRSINIEAAEEEIAKHNLTRQEKVRNIKHLASDEALVANQAKSTTFREPSKLDELLDQVLLKSGTKRSTEQAHFYDDVGGDRAELEKVVDDIRVQFLELLTAKKKVDGFARKFKQEADTLKSRLRASQQISASDSPSMSPDILVGNIKLLEQAFANNIQLARSIYYNISAHSMGKYCQRMGLLYAEYEGKWRRRWFIVRDNFLFVYKDSKALAPIRCMNLGDCVAMKLHDTDRKFVFQITSSGDDELHISAGSEDTRNAWVESISNCSNWFEKDCMEIRVKEEKEDKDNLKQKRGKSKSTFFRSRKSESFSKQRGNKMSISTTGTAQLRTSGQ